MSASEDFHGQLWTWYATDEYDQVFEACGWMRAIHFLQLPAAEQSARIPYCPACETWSDMMVPVQRALENLPPGVPQLEQQLHALWGLCHDLPESAMRCGDFDLFKDPAWMPLRSAAAEALRLMGWEFLEAQIDELERECGEKLFPSKARGG